MKNRPTVVRMRWGGIEPPRLAARGPQPRLSTKFQHQRELAYYNLVYWYVKQIVLL
jgi:hypothetical protein